VNQILFNSHLPALYKRSPLLVMTMELMPERCLHSTQPLGLCLNPAPWALPQQTLLNTCRFLPGGHMTRGGASFAFQLQWAAFQTVTPPYTSTQSNLSPPAPRLRAQLSRMGGRDFPPPHTPCLLCSRESAPDLLRLCTTQTEKEVGGQEGE
jgi:hypothetical protein